MKRKLLTILITFMIMVGCYGMIVLYVSHTETKSPSASPGEFNLSNWQFSTKGAVPLSGIWDFYPNQLLTPSDFSRQNNPARHQLISVPGSWSSKMNTLGVATYRLRVKVSDIHAIYGLKIPSVQMSSRVFVNDVMVGSSGYPAKGSSYVGKNEPFVAFFTMHPGFNNMIVQVANFDLPSSSGIRQPIYFGYANQVSAIERQALSYDYVSVALFMVMGLYFWGWYFQRRRDHSVLLFGLLCICLGLFSAFRGEKVIYDVFPSIPDWLILRVQMVSATGASVVMLLYVYSAFRIYCVKRLVWMALIAGGILIVTELSMDNIVFTKPGILVTSIFVIFALCYTTSVLVEGTLAKAEGSFYMFGAAVALSMYALLNNLTIYFQMSEYNFPPIASFVFILMLSMRKSLRFSNTFHQNRLLSKRLIRADKLKDEFLSKTAHEFKTPLHGMISISEALLADDAKAPLSPAQRENVELISTSARRLSRLVYDILDFVRLQQGDLKVSPAPLDIHSSVEAILRLYSFMIKEENPVRLVNHVPKSLPFALADEGRFRQVCINLLDNALKHTHKGVIEVTAIANGDWIEVSVADSGTGIHEHNLDVIFTPFTSLTSDSNQSFGLGLTIVKQLVELQRGQVWVASTSSEGTTVTFSLPLAMNPSSKSRRQAYDSSEMALPSIPEPSFPLPYMSREPGDSTILIVDDAFSNLKVLIHLLEKLNFSVIAVNRGEDALELLETSGEIDLVLLDLMMPGLSGIEVCQAIRTKYSLLELPVVMVTASIHPEDKIAAFAAGANDYVSKPFDETELRARINSLLVMRDSATKATEMEVAFLQSQIKPHFLFNVLNTVMALSYTDTEKARKLTADLSDYLRGSFSFGNVQSKVPFHHEFALIQSYVDIEKARFKDRIQVEYDITPIAFHVMVPPLIIQPLVENAIRHGIGNCVEGGTVRVKAFKRDIHLVFEIEDDGVGMSKERLGEVLSMEWNDQQEGHRSVGLKNINKRLKYWYGTELAIKSTVGFGTTVMLSVLAVSD